MLYESKERIKQSLASHSWLGIAMGAVLYLICLSGTLAVFLHELERWQQPDIEEFSELPASAISRAYQQFMAQINGPQKTVWVILPTADLPRAHVSNGDVERFTNHNGDLKNEPIEGWVGMVRELHYYLHLPKNIGMIVVAIFGVMLIALTVSGVMAHPSILKDAFKFRVSQTYRLQQTDLHNRLSVWGLPFILVITLTGAFIGLVNVLVLAAAPLFYDGDRDAVVSAVYGADPVVITDQRTFNVEKAIGELKRVAPEVTPIYIAFQQPDSEGQFLEIAATLPGRLTFSEIYRFDSEGNFFNHQGLSDGPIGRQIAYSVYRLHFGQFGGFAVKLMYAFMGLALTMACASGINIWLAKRKYKNWHNDVWVGFVWGTPLALSVSAIAAMANPLWATLTFWCVLSLTLTGALYRQDDSRSRVMIKLALGLSLLLIVTVHSAIHGVQSLFVPVWTTHIVASLLGFYWTISAYRKLGVQSVVVPEVTSA